MKKIILISFLTIFLCCGCTVDYKLTINKDLTLTEEIKAMQPQTFFSEYNNSTTEEVIDLLATSNGLKEKDYKKILKKDSSGVEIKNNYNSINDFSSNSIYYKQYFDDIDYEEKDGKIKLSLKSNIINDPDYPESFLIDKTTIKVKVPYKVISSNADDVNAFTNTYTWYIYEDTEIKNIDIEFDKNVSRFDYSIFTKYIPIILTIMFLLILAYIIFKFVINKNIENNKF